MVRRRKTHGPKSSEKGLKTGEKAKKSPRQRGEYSTYWDLKGIRGASLGKERRNIPLPGENFRG